MSEEEKNTDLVPADDSAREEKSSKEAIPETLRILESLVFASDELLTAARLRSILPGNPSSREISSMVSKINRQLAKERHPFEIVEIGGGYQFKTVAYYHPWVRQIFQEKAAKRLSVQALECLSIIAYRQPLSKAEIEAIRGVISDGAMKTLLERRLITITGRSEKPGRPLLYGTTPDFLKYFGLNKIDDLPNIEEFEAMIRQKIENLPAEELQAVQEQAKSEAAKEAGAAPAAEPAPIEESIAELISGVEEDRRQGGLETVKQGEPADGSAVDPVAQPEAAADDTPEPIDVPTLEEEGAVDAAPDMPVEAAEDTENYQPDQKPEAMPEETPTLYMEIGAMGQADDAEPPVEEVALCDDGTCETATENESGDVEEEIERPEEKDEG